jgi:O-antigen/teichoic acid export membrane protein
MINLKIKDGYMEIDNLKNEDFKQIKAYSRSRRLIKNVSVSFINKFLSMLLNFLMIPLTITYLSQDVYGVWVTLLSILSWFGFCDIGLGNGLRNKLTECLSKDDKKNARSYISTAYIVISIIVVVILVPLIFIIPFINWNRVLNVNIVSNIELIKLIYITIVFFMINFILSIINQIYYAYQNSMYVGFIQVITNVMMITGIIILKGLNTKSIVYLAAIYGGATLITNLIFSFIFFRTNRDVMPSIKEFQKSKVLDISTLGVKFFIIQIAAIVIFTTDNIVITQVLGPKYVTQYNIVQKLFGALITLHIILITPLWSAFTEAYIKKDCNWIKKIIRKLNLLMIPILVAILVVYFSFDFIMKLWIGQSVNVSKSLIILVAIYTAISIWSNIYSYLLNGIGYLKVSFWNCILISVVNVPLSIYFAAYLNLGVEGIVISNILCLSTGAIIQPIQTYIILNNKIPNSVFYK